jgi:hypothetical protein
LIKSFGLLKRAKLLVFLQNKNLAIVRAKKTDRALFNCGANYMLLGLFPNQNAMNG